MGAATFSGSSQLAVTRHTQLLRQSRLVTSRPFESLQGRELHACRQLCRSQPLVWARAGGAPARGPPRPPGPNRGPPRPPGSRPPMSRPGGNNRFQQQGNRNEFSVTMNNQIQASEVRVLAGDKEMLGVMTFDAAMDMAEDQGVDLILVAPDASPPVCRLIEFSKYKYELDKAKKDASKKQRESRIEMKELKLRPNTDVHDYQVRLRAAERFIAKGNKVKLSLQFRGREMEFQGIGKEMFARFMEDLKDTAIVETRPSFQGRVMSMVIAPAKGAPKV